MKKIAFLIPVLLIPVIGTIGCISGPVAETDANDPPPPPPLPSVGTADTTSVTATSATLRGIVNTHGMDGSAWFEWSANPDLQNPNLTAKMPLPPGQDYQSISDNVTGLTPETKYYFRAVGQNSLGTGAGAIQSFTTHSLNLIHNGSFEVPDIKANSTSWADGFDSVWSTHLLGTSYLIVDNVFGWPAFDGQQYAVLDTGYYNNGIAQYLTTTPGRSYDISFAYSPWPGQDNTTNTIELFIEMALTVFVSDNGQPTGPTWRVHSYTFTAKSTSTKILFLAQGAVDGYGGLLDNVQVYLRP